MMNYGLQGSLQQECKTGWMKALLDPATAHTMLCEGVLGTMKSVSATMGTGKISSRKARVGARCGGVWPLVDAMTDEEYGTVDTICRRALKTTTSAESDEGHVLACTLKTYDRVSKEKHDEAETERKFRDMERQTHQESEKIV